MAVIDMPNKLNRYGSIIAIIIIISLNVTMWKFHPTHSLYPQWIVNIIYGSIYLWLKLLFATFGQRIAKWWNLRVKPSSIVSLNSLLHNPLIYRIRGVKCEITSKQISKRLFLGLIRCWRGLLYSFGLVIGYKYISMLSQLHTFSQGYLNGIGLEANLLIGVHGL